MGIGSEAIGETRKARELAQTSFQFVIFRYMQFIATGI
jgi:hypothetical protein